MAGDTHTKQGSHSGVQPVMEKLGIAMLAAAEVVISSPALPVTAGDLLRHI